MRDEGGVPGGPGLSERRWKRFGQDRVYLSVNGDVQVGFIDLNAQVVVLDDPAFEAQANEALARWCPTEVPQPMPRPASPDSAGPSSANGLPKLIKATRNSTCTVCGAKVPKGDDLFWVAKTKVVVCPACTAAEVAAGIDSGTAGGAASRIAGGAARKHAQRLLAAYPMLGDHLVANARPTHTMHAWLRGADGERIVGRKLDIAAEDGRIVVLHDRQLPYGGNIDHLVIGPRRICVIDAKHYRNAKITKKDDTLRINGESMEHLIDGVRQQSAAVADAMRDRPRIADNVVPVLAFVGAKLGFAESISHRGVWCSDVKEAVSYAAWRLPLVGGTKMKLDADQRQEIAELLARAFPAC